MAKARHLVPARGSPVLERVSQRVTVWTGSSWAFGTALLLVLGWAVSGPLFSFSNTWQLVINTGTTIATFLMVFLIQRAQNKDAAVLHLKLNEIVAALHGASNRLIGVENLSEEEVRTLHRHYQRLIALARRDADLQQSHSIEEAEAHHSLKQRRASRS